jgi:hypothetical protein
MNKDYYGYLLSGILISGAGMSACALILTIVLTSTQKPRLYQLLRYGMTTAGFSLSTFGMVLWVLGSLIYESHIDPAEARTMWMGVACFSIPMLMGAWAAIGPKYPYVRWSGRVTMYILTPFAILWLLTLAASNSDLPEIVFWMILYVAVAALWWEGIIYWDHKLQILRRKQWENILHRSPNVTTDTTP